MRHKTYKKFNVKDKVKSQLRDGSRRSMLAVCDFTDIPLAFGDMVCFVWNADVYRGECGAEKVDIVFVYDEKDPCLPNPYVTKETFRHYFYNLSVEATRLCHNLGNLFVFSNKSEFIDFFTSKASSYVDVFPNDYDYLNPVEHRKDRPACYWYSYSSDKVKDNSDLLSLNIDKTYLDHADKWLSRFVRPKVPVSITLRECWPEERSNNIPEWQKLIDRYSDVGFVVIRDYAKIYDDPNLFGAYYYDVPSFSLSYRAAFYQKCPLNLFVLSGPLMLAHLNNKVNYIAFRFHTPGGSGVSSPKSVKDLFSINEPDNFIGATKYQKVVWEKDDFKSMSKHVDDMIDVLKENGKWH